MYVMLKFCFTYNIVVVMQNGVCMIKASGYKSTFCGKLPYVAGPFTICVRVIDVHGSYAERCSAPLEVSIMNTDRRIMMCNLKISNLKKNGSGVFPYYEFYTNFDVMYMAYLPCCKSLNLLVET